MSTKNTPTKLRTAAEARAWLGEQGLSIAEWSRMHGFGVSLVRKILESDMPCLRGMSHQIAVRLGMKRGVITRSPEEARQRGPHTAREAAAAAAAAAADQPGASA